MFNEICMHIGPVHVWRSKYPFFFFFFFSYFFFSYFFFSYFFFSYFFFSFSYFFFFFSYFFFSYFFFFFFSFFFFSYFFFFLPLQPAPRLHMLQRTVCFFGVFFDSMNRGHATTTLTAK